MYARYLKLDITGTPRWKSLVNTSQRKRAGAPTLLGAADDFLVRLAVAAHRQFQPFQKSDLMKYAAQTATHMGLTYTHTGTKQQVPYTEHTDMSSWWKVGIAQHLVHARLGLFCISMRFGHGEPLLIQVSVTLVHVCARACRDGWSPLLAGSGGGHLSCVEALIRLNADIFQCNK